ncbi:BTB/POZ domain-containing protein KCTD18 [Passer montanus]|uniref:BTB/POZ domain-containing protein KCTD18 n=1 Tax=Passer montanus TaxID=9160 RepID=UPI0019618889|nr:BTB/POZ domain-containing protein KCTD18 [Passer montanus]
MNRTTNGAKRRRWAGPGARGSRSGERGAAAVRGTREHTGAQRARENSAAGLRPAAEGASGVRYAQIQRVGIKSISFSNAVIITNLTLLCANITIFYKALLDFCASHHLVCTKPTVWVLHYLNISGANCESKIMGVHATRADGTDAINKVLGMKIPSKCMYKR